MPISNINLGFILKRSLDFITIEKTGVRDITAQVFYRKNKKSYVVLTTEKEVNPILNIKIPFQDGQYKIKIVSTDEQEQFEYEEYLFSNYNSLLDSIIEQAQDYLCGCKCEDCGDNVDIEKELIIKMMSFYILNNDYYSFFFNKGLSCIENDIMQKINCIIANDYIKGKSDIEYIATEIIGYLYYIFYIGERSIYTCCIEEIDIKFNILDIYNCLVEKNIDLDCIENKIVTDPDFYISDSNFIKIN